MWVKLFPDYHPPSADGDSSLGRILTTAFGGWKLFPGVYFLRNFSLMKYRLNGRIFTPEKSIIFPKLKEEYKNKAKRSAK